MLTSPLSSDPVPIQSPATDPSAWRPSDFQHDDSWCHVLATDQIQAILRAARAWRQRDFRSLTRTEACELLAPLLPMAQAITSELGSRGFALVRGVPVDDLPREDVGLVYWAIGLLFGTGL